ncbi:MAG: transketolase [Alphaproteobacteria bacterium]
MASPRLRDVTDPRAAERTHRLACLRALEAKVLWLSAWTIHNANHLRPSRDGLKVGGHQASCASAVTLLSALYFHVLRPEDRIAVKPHASPVFHAIQYLLGNQDRGRLEKFRAFGGAQSYPSRTKDTDDVDFSTGSVGLGGAVTLFASLVQDYLRLHGLMPEHRPTGRLIALIGDAELDEGNVFEAMLEGWKHDVRNLWWIIDYNRQSLDSIVTDRLYGRIDRMFQTVDWRVEVLKYGKRLEAAFARPGGDALREWIDNCPNSLYSALTFKGGAAWRENLARDLAGVRGIKALLDDHDDAALQALMTNLAGHDMESVLEAFEAVEDDAPRCFIAYTIKGFGLPLAGHKDNHAGLMTPAQMIDFKRAMGIADGEEWAPFAGLDVDPEALRDFLDAAPFNREGRRRFTAWRVPVPETLPFRAAPRMATQEAFGRILHELGRGDSELARRIVTTSPDVTVSTGLGPWVNQRAVFDRHEQADVFREEQVASAQRWLMSQKGQHIELGIAENNLFLILAALGLSAPLFGERLLPIGTLYDPFIQRGLDALNYACYQDSRFMLVATPSGITLAPEGGAHQSLATPLIGMAQDGIAAFEPAFVDELAAIMAWGFDYLQRDGSGGSEIEWLRDMMGGSVYLRLSTRPIDQAGRVMDDGLRRNVIAGGYWLREPAPGAELAIVFSGAVAPEAIEAHARIVEEIPDAGLLAVTSADRLNAGWHAAGRARQAGHRDARAHVERLLAALAPGAALVTVIDGHPATLGWLGAVLGQRVHPLGVEHFGQSGDLPDLYRAYRLDVDAILEAIAAACLERARATRLL